jgi:hypothetical protein
MPAPGEAQSAADEDVLLDTEVSLDPVDILDVFRARYFDYVLEITANRPPFTSLRLDIQH